MKKSIFFAFIILIISLGWIISGQFDNDNDQSNQNSVIDSKTKDITDGKIKEEVNSIKVETKIFTSEKIDQSITIQGQTLYNKKIDIKSETIGNIVEINFKRGDKVKKNSSLIKLSKENKEELLNSAKELIKLYEIEYSSIKKLIEKGLSSRSKLVLASFNLADAKSNLKNIQLNIENTNIIAPFEGIITDKFVEVSDFVTPGSILLTIVNLNPIKIKGYLSEFDINKIKQNTQAMIKNSNGVIKNGQITFISPLAEIGTRAFEVIIEADNSDLSFKSGMTTSIIIEGSELIAHKIPTSILTLKDDGSIGVKSLNDKNIVNFYPIQKVKDTIDGMWVNGLPETINLIISGQEYVSIGQKIDTR